MGDRTQISWTDHTFNPLMGCAKVSAGCANCYAEKLTGDRMGLQLWGPAGKRQVTSNANWRKPLKWDRDAADLGSSSRVFCASLCDVFEDHPVVEATRPRLWDLVRRTPHLDWQLLTKRADRIASCLPVDWGSGWRNVWLGVSVEDEHAAWRVDALRGIPTKVRFISYEPALGPIDNVSLSRINWLIFGGESGPRRRPADIVWARQAMDRCRASGTAFFFKQGGGPRPGDTVQQESVDDLLQVKQWPMERRVFCERQKCESLT